MRHVLQTACQRKLPRNAPRCACADVLKPTLDCRSWGDALAELLALPATGAFAERMALEPADALAGNSGSCSAVLFVGVNPCGPGFPWIDGSPMKCLTVNQQASTKAQTPTT